jgi:hypothetical protein
MTSARVWQRFAIAMWVGALGCFGTGWFAGKPNVQAATAPLVACYIIAAARSRTLARTRGPDRLARPSSLSQPGRG